MYVQGTESIWLENKYTALEVEMPIKLFILNKQVRECTHDKTIVACAPGNPACSGTHTSLMLLDLNQKWNVLSNLVKIRHN